MAKYSDIKGFTVQTLASDTAASAITAGSWASSNDLNTGRSSGGGAGVLQTAAVVFGGQTPTAVANTESYNGSSWTELNDLNTARTQASRGQGGTYTSAIYGTKTGANVIESWDGSSWTEIAEINTARYNTGISGASNTSSLIFGGEVPGAGYSALTETWNGSSWTETNDLNTARNSGAAVGTATAGLYVGGQIPPNSAGDTVESWNGSSWSELSEIAYNVRDAAGFGPYTEAVIAGGQTVATVQYWNGSSWTEIADMSAAKYGMAGAGASTAGLVAGGYANIASTEEFTAPAVFNQQVEGQLYFNSTTNTFKETILDVPAGAWSSGGNLNEGRPVGAGYGSSNLAAGLAGGDNSTDNEAYNGTSWTEVNELNTARSNANGTGSFTAGLVVGGYPPNTANAESWNGTNFTEVADLNTARGYQSGAGTANTANIAIGGFSSPPTQRLTVCEQYDGSSWTEVGDLTRSAAMNSTGSTSGSPYTSALCIGGYNAPNSPNTYSDLVESWDGSSWTSSTAMSNRRTLPVGNGASVNDVVVAGGGGSAARTEIWNGSSWTELGDPSISNKFRQSGGTASTTAGIMSGAPDGTPEASTEEWNALLANKTITAS